MMATTNESQLYELTKQDLECLLRQQLGSDLKVESFNTKALTQPGENYGSTMLSAELIVQKAPGKINKLSLVAKLVPQLAFLREAFDVEITFNKEVNLYQLVIPEYNCLQQEKGIPESKILDIFPKFYGARTNRQGNMNDKADDTAVLLLENLKISGYLTGNRVKGLNLKHMQLGVTGLARFHATSVALKILKPQVFKETVLKTCESFKVGSTTKEEEAEKLIKATLEDVKLIPECIPYMGRIETALHEDMIDRRNPSPPPSSEPFATLVHNDFWVNNMMFKYESTGYDSNQISDFETPSGIKFVDFQTTLYASPIKDLIFFLYSSVADGVIGSHYDKLINLYHHIFIACLSELGCVIDQFSFKHFEKELNTCGPKEFAHILYMLKFISATKSELPDMTCDSNILLNVRVGELYSNKVKSFVLDFVNKEWL